MAICRPASRAPRAWASGLLAAAVAAGATASAVAQTPDATVSVEAPRAQVTAPPSPLSVLPDAAQAAAFRISSINAPPDPPQPVLPAVSPPAGSSSSIAPSDASISYGSLPPTSGGAPISSGTWPPMTSSGTPYPYMPTAAVAPAWRWHGYGGVTPAEQFQPSTPAPDSATKERPPAAPSPPQNPGTDAPHMPASPPPTPPADGPKVPTLSDVNAGSESKPPSAVPAYVPPADPNPPPPSPAPPGQPLSATEPTWRSGVRQVGYLQANPMTAGPAPWSAATTTPPVVIAGAATITECHQPAVTLDRPRVAGTYISRAVSDAPVQPVTYSAPPAPPKNQPVGVLPTVRTSIERACAGRVRDVEIVSRGATNLLVRLKVRQTADAEFVANAIARLPELGPYQVLFEMQVVR